MIKVEYVDHMGTDLTVVDAARVSFAKKSDGTQNERDRKLIKYLADHDHWTPFGHPQITVRVQAPVFVRTQCFKHKQGFVENEVSRRYVDTPPSFWMPAYFRLRAENKKQGSSSYSLTGRDEEKARATFQMIYEDALADYERLLSLGVCPEQARAVLPQGMMTEWFWTGSLYAYANFYIKRSAPDAQAEVREVAVQVADIIAPLFPVSWNALVGWES